MTALNTFIADRLPLDVSQGRDYSGSRGWVSLCNQLLRRLENEELIKLTQLKETGTEVDNSYWITLPSDYRSGLEIFYFSDFNKRINIPYQIINGKIKLDESFSKSDDPDTFTLSSGGTSSIAINDDDATENQWEGYLLVLTNGTYSGDGIIIGEHSEASEGLTTLNFLHSRSTSIATSTAGYLTQMYVMLRYMASFTGLSEYNSDIPVDQRFENILINGFCYMAKPIGSDERNAYRAEFENDIQLLKNEIFTPTPDQARPLPRSMPALSGYGDTTGSHTDFIGDEDAWLE